MATATLNGVEIAYDDIAPPGPAQRTVMLLHGYSSNRAEGWKRTGWYTALERRGMRMIALDQRGHGESAKPHDPAAYGRLALAADALALLDHLGVGRCDVFGFSMGTRTALQLAIDAPDRVSNLILGGVGDKLMEPRSSELPPDAMAQAMLAEDPESISHPFLKSFRLFADEQGEDRTALAAFTRAESPPLDRAAMGALPMPVLVVAGARDESAGDPDGLARLFPHGQGVTLPACDHFSVIPHVSLKATVFDFLDGVLGLDDEFPPFE